MKPPIFVRELSKQERQDLQAGLRSRETFVMRRSQILLASARGLSPPKIARSLGCGSQTARNAIHAFNERGMALWSKAPCAPSASTPPSTSGGPKPCGDAPPLPEGVRIPH